MFPLLTQSRPYVVGHGDKAHEVLGVRPLWALGGAGQHCIWSRETWVDATALLFSGYVTLAKSPPQAFPPPLLESGNHIACLPGLVGGVSKHYFKRVARVTI